MSSKQRQRALEQRSQDGFAHLQSMYSTPSPKNSRFKQPKQIKLDGALQATKEMFDVSARLCDANSILESCCSLLSDDDVGMAQRKSMANSIKRLVLPLNKVSAEMLRQAAVKAAPIAGCERYHKRCEVDRKRAAEAEVENRSKLQRSTTVPMERIASHLKVNCNDPDPRERKVRAATISPDADVELPLPANRSTMVYTKPEAVAILSATKKGSKQRGNMMQTMISKKYAPTSEHTLRRLLKNAAAGDLILDTSWSGNGHNGGGRKRAFEDSDVDALVTQWKRGEAHGEDSVKDAISRAQQEVVVRSGGVPVKGRDNVSPQTVRNVTAVIANHHGVALVDKATGKTDHRVIAERSHRRIACLVGLIGSTHLLSIPEENMDIRHELKRLPESVRTLIDHVSEARGTAVFPVKPHNLWSIYDTTTFVFAGLSTLSDKIKLTLKGSVQCSANESIWILDSNNSMKGLRVSWTFSFAAIGTCLELVVCVSGLSESQLIGTDFLHLEIPGFCIGGGANTENKGLGHVLFMRSTDGAKQKSSSGIRNMSLYLASTGTAWSLTASMCPLSRRSP